MISEGHLIENPNFNIKFPLSSVQIQINKKYNHENEKPIIRQILPLADAPLIRERSDKPAFLNAI